MRQATRPSTAPAYPRSSSLPFTTHLGVHVATSQQMRSRRDLPNRDKPLQLPPLGLPRDKGAPTLSDKTQHPRRCLQRTSCAIPIADIIQKRLAPTYCRPPRWIPAKTASEYVHRTVPWKYTVAGASRGDGYFGGCRLKMYNCIRHCARV